MSAVAVEREDGVDDVLEHARPGDGALLGDVADEQGGEVALLRELHEPVGAVAHLRDRAGCPRPIGIDHRLDRVDREHIGGDRLRVGDDVVEIGRADDEQLRRDRADPLGAHPDLRG